MSDIIHNTYKNELIDFLLSKNLKFFLVNVTYQSSYRNRMDSLEIHFSKNDIKIDDSSSISNTIREITDKAEISKHLYTYNLGNHNNEFAKDFFYIFYNKYPKYQKELLNKAYTYFNVNLKNNFEKFISKTSKNYNEAVKQILNYPISVWKVELVEFDRIHNKLKEIGGTHEEILKFWTDFFKAREKQIKLVANSKKVSDFLISKYEYSELENFFPFFSYLQAKYEDIPLNIFDSDYRLSTSIFLNIKKMHSSFSLDGWDYKDYENALSLFSKAIKDYHKLEESHFSAINRAKKSFAMVFFHNNDSFVQEKLKQLVGDFFNSLKRNPKEVSDLSPEFFKSWLSQNELRNSLAEKNDVKPKMKKI